MDPEDAPRIVIAEPDAEDLSAMVTALKELVPLGLRVSASVVRDRLGLPDPADGDELLGTPAPAPGGSGFSRDGKPLAAAPARGNDPEPPVSSPAAPALNRAEPPTPVPDYDPGVMDRLTTEGQAAIDGMVGQLRAMLGAAGSMEEALAMLESAYPQLDAGALAESVTAASLVAHLAGRADVLEEGMKE